MPYAPKQYRTSTWKPAATQRDRTAPSSERGYSDGWTETRDNHKAAHPYCQDCPYPKATYVEVDHIIPFKGMNDPLRLDEGNLRTRCRRHHALKTARYDYEIRRYYEQHGRDATLARYREAMAEVRRVP